MISVSHLAEEVEVNVEEGAEKEEDSEPGQSRDEEPSTSTDHAKQEVRNGAHKGPLPPFLCLHGGFAACGVKLYCGELK